MVDVELAVDEDVLAARLRRRARSRPSRAPTEGHGLGNMASGPQRLGGTFDVGPAPASGTDRDLAGAAGLTPRLGEPGPSPLVATRWVTLKHDRMACAPARWCRCRADHVTRCSRGLTDAEVAERRVRDGPNVLPAARRRPLVRSCSPSGRTSSPLLLWVAAVLALVAGMPQLAVAIARGRDPQRRVRVRAGAPGRAGRRPAAGPAAPTGSRCAATGARQVRRRRRAGRAATSSCSTPGDRVCADLRRGRRRRAGGRHVDDDRRERAGRVRSRATRCSPARSSSRARRRPWSWRSAATPSWPSSPR